MEFQHLNGANVGGTALFVIARYVPPSSGWMDGESTP